MNKKLKFKKSPSLWEGFRMGLIIFLSIAICTTINAQTPQSNFINYQGVASDAAGAVMADQSITVGIVLRYATTGAAAYAENHSITTDTNGVFSLKIGNGTATTGTYDNFHWGDNMGIAAFVTVAINGTEIGTTELLAVPYAITSGDNRWTQDGDDIENLNTGIVKVNSNLEIGANIQLQLGPAANEISTDGTLAGNSDKTIPTEKAVKTYMDANKASGLEKITEDGKSGWRLVGQNDNILPGDGAIDLSTKGTTTTSTGASGENSFSFGFGTFAREAHSFAIGNESYASGDYSFSLGNVNETFGVGSFAIGSRLAALSFHEIVLGSNNTLYSPLGTESWEAQDRLLVLGNGTSSLDRSDALIVYKNGNAQFNGKVQTTATNSAHMLPIAYGTIESDGNVLSGTGNFTASVSGGVFTIIVNDGEIPLSANNSSCSIIPYSSTFRTSSVLHSAGNLSVYIFDVSGNNNPTTFQFVIYRL